MTNSAAATNAAAGAAHNASAEGVTYIDIGPQTWAQALPVYIALLEDGTSEGKRIARDALRRMARVADIGVLAANRLTTLRDRPFLDSPEVKAMGGQLDAESDAPPVTARVPGTDHGRVALGIVHEQSASHPKHVAVLASRCLGREVALEICRSAAGFYLGVMLEHEPYTRESVEYWPKREDAQAALGSGRWTQRNEV